jgi:hypothetical protein
MQSRIELRRSARAEPRKSRTEAELDPGLRPKGFVVIERTGGGGVCAQLRIGYWETDASRQAIEGRYWRASRDCSRKFAPPSAWA